MKKEDLTPLQAQELAESQKARQALKRAKSAPAPSTSTQMPSQQARNGTAWAGGSATTTRKIPSPLPLNCPPRSGNGS